MEETKMERRKQSLNYPLIWLVLLIAFAGIEGLTAGLVSIWFALGSLAALFAAWMHANLLVQIGIFAIVSIIAMAIIRPLAAKYWQPKVEKTNADRILEQEGVVTEEVDNLRALGQIKVAGAVWTARSADNTVIPVGTLVQVERIEGVKAIVREKKGKGEEE